MDLPDLKKLSKIIAMCRKQGVDSIEIQGVKITLKDVQPEFTAPRSKKSSPPIQEHPPVESDGWDSLSEEDKLLWSSGSTTES